MTCQECEIKLGMGEDAGEHLASCLECRRLAGELRLNSVALREMRVEWAAAGPGGPARTRASAPRFAAALEVAAAVVVAIGVWRMPVARRHPEIMAAHGAAPPLQQQLLQQKQPTIVRAAKVVHRKKRVRKPAETLRVKMFTSDPDVVIYWIVDKKEGYE